MRSVRLHGNKGAGVADYSGARFSQRPSSTLARHLKGLYVRPALTGTEWGLSVHKCSQKHDLPCRQQHQMAFQAHHAHLINATCSCVTHVQEGCISYTALAAHAAALWEHQPCFQHCTLCRPLCSAQLTLQTSWPVDGLCAITADVVHAASQTGEFFHILSMCTTVSYMGCIADGADREDHGRADNGHQQELRVQPHHRVGGRLHMLNQ